MSRMKNLTLLFLLTFSYHTYSQSSESVLFMEKENGVFTLPCKVNGIPMKFIFDTGASNVSISLTEAQFLAKQGLLKESEILNSVKYRIANGEVQEGTRIILRQIEIGKHVLKNVEALITQELNSPLLLGQSAISKLGKIAIDGEKLIITSEDVNNRFEFLNIDLTKHINDFGYSAWDLQEPLTPYALEILKENNTHFLSTYKFDKEVALFSQEGYIPIIVLQKEFKNEKYHGDNERNAKKFFKEITKVITEKYGSHSTANARVIEWNSPDYQMMLNIASDNSVMLSYNNLNIQYLENSGDVIPKTTKRYEDKPIQDFATSLRDYFNDFLKSLKQQDIRSFARLDKNTLEIHFEKQPQIWPSSEEAYMQIEIKKMEKTMIENYSEYVITNSFKSSDDLKILRNSKLDRIKFILEISYADNTSSRSVRQVFINELVNSRTPISRSEFLRILY